MGRGVGAGRTFTSGGVTAARSVVDGAGVEAVAGNPPLAVLLLAGALLLAAAEVGGFAGETFGLAAAMVPVPGAVLVAGVAPGADAVLREGVLGATDASSAGWLRRVSGTTAAAR